MIKAIAIDDEPLALEIIKKYCDLIDEVELFDTFTSPMEALKFIKENNLDVIFLDIQMPEMEGFDLINFLDKKTKVILTTAYNEFALKSYDFGVLDYLLKPIPFPRFYDAISKYKAIANNPSVDSNEVIYVNLGHEYFSVKIDSILYIQGQGDYVEIYFDDKKVLTRENLKVLESQFENFIRIHKSYMINKDRIQWIKSSSLKLTNGKELPIGRQYKQNIKELIKSKTVG